MKQLSTLLFLIVLISCKQENALLQYKQHFDQELKPWTNSFYHFNLANFKKGKTLPFEGGSAQDLASYKKFISTYKPILTFSPDSSKFIDLFTVQLNLVKVGDLYEANADDGGAIYYVTLQPNTGTGFATAHQGKILKKLPGSQKQNLYWPVLHNHHLIQ